MKALQRTIPILVATGLFLATKSNAADRYDFVWVLDNSSQPTAVADRKALSAGFGDFLTTLQSKNKVDYRMVVVTTDYFNNQGNPVKSASGNSFVTSTSSNPVTDFKALIDQVEESPTDFWPQGLEASRQALAKVGFPENHGVPVAIIYVSQDDDYSCQANCYGIEPWDNPNWLPYSEEFYAASFRDVGNNSSSPVSIFPIIAKNPANCEFWGHGLRYLRVMNQLGSGVAGGVCPDQVHDSLMNIAHYLSGT